MPRGVADQGARGMENPRRTDARAQASESDRFSESRRGFLVTWYDARMSAGRVLLWGLASGLAGGTVYLAYKLVSRQLLCGGNTFMDMGETWWSWHLRPDFPGLITSEEAQKIQVGDRFKIAVTPKAEGQNPTRLIVTPAVVKQIRGWGPDDLWAYRLCYLNTLIHQPTAPFAATELIRYDYDGPVTLEDLDRRG